LHRKRDVFSTRSQSYDRELQRQRCKFLQRHQKRVFFNSHRRKLCA
jgi:hypothetical protein